MTPEMEVLAAALAICERRAKYLDGIVKRRERGEARRPVGHDYDEEEAAAIRLLVTTVRNVHSVKP